jgi:tetratricopeptide (TPR) repeat protein
MELTAMLKELIEAKKLAKIAVSDKPLKLGGEIRYLTPDEMKREFSFDYHESLYGNPEEIEKYLRENKSLIEKLKVKKDIPDEQAVLHRLRNPLDCLIISKCALPPSGAGDDKNGLDIGYGLFTSKRIAKGTVLFLYAGSIQKSKRFEDSDSYGYEWAEESSLKMISSMLGGGLARFLQHLPLDREKEIIKFKRELSQKFGSALLYARDFDLDSHVRKIYSAYPDDSKLEDIQFRSQDLRAKLATSNIMLNQMLIKGMPAVVCEASEDIEAGSILGFDYGKNYWLASNKQPAYFTKVGTVIQKTDYWHKAKPASDDSVHALIGSKNINPLKQYEDAMANYQEKKYQEAKDKFQTALEGFQKNNPNSEACGKCYSALSSCCSKLNENANAIHYCEKALLTFYMNKDRSRLEKLIPQYHGHLSCSDVTPNNLYQQAVEIYKNENKALPIALYKLLLAIQKFSNPIEQASCHSTIGSCYEKLSEPEMAIHHYQQALNLREMHLGANDNQTQHVRNKLLKIKKENEAKPSAASPLVN